jgi:hypothetical protein
MILYIPLILWGLIGNRYRKFLSELLDKMQELQGSDSDE